MSGELPEDVVKAVEAVLDHYEGQVSTFFLAQEIAKAALAWAPLPAVTPEMVQAALGVLEASGRLAEGRMSGDETLVAEMLDAALDVAP